MKWLSALFFSISACSTASVQLKQPSWRDEAPKLLLAVTHRDSRADVHQVTLHAWLRGEPREANAWDCLLREWWEDGQKHSFDGTPLDSPCNEVWQDREWDKTISILGTGSISSTGINLIIHDHRGRKIAWAHTEVLTN